MDIFYEMVINWTKLNVSQFQHHDFNRVTVDRLQSLLPETSGCSIDRYDLPNLGAVNFVIRGLLGEGVTASTKVDPQAKALGEFLRTRIVEAP